METGMRRRSTALRIVALCLGLGLWSSSGCTPTVGPRLVFAADPSVVLSLAQSDMRSTDVLSFGAMMLCMSPPGTAQLDGVRIDRPEGDIQVEAFAVRPNPMPAGEGLGGLRTTLASFSPAFRPSEAQLVNGACPQDFSAPTLSEAAALTELGVQVRLGSGDLGGGRALLVDYRVNGERRMLSIPFGIWLCARTCPPNIGDAASPAN